MKFPDHDIIETEEKFSGGKQWRLEVLRNNISRNDDGPSRVRVYRGELLIFIPSSPYQKAKNPPGPDHLYMWVEGDHVWPNFSNDTAQRALHDALAWLRLYDH